MTQQSFVRRRQGDWERIEGIINGGRSMVRAHASWFPRAFRELTGDLNIARANAFDPILIERLNRLVLEGNQLLYGQYPWPLRALPRFIFHTFPVSVRAHWRGILVAHLFFYGLALFFGFLCVRFPEMVYELIPYRQAHDLETMYDPQSSHFLSPRELSSDADMFGFYIYNNVSIAFNTFAGGILAGVGSIIILAFNGVFLGVAAAHIINKGFSSTFFPFIIGHSSFELSAIVLSAYAGLLMGFRFFVTRGLSRGASLKRAGRAALPLILGSMILLFIAALVEAFWSSRHELPAELRYGAGAAGWALLLLYFLLSGRRGSYRGKVLSPRKQP